MKDWGSKRWPLFDWGPADGYRVHWDWRLEDRPQGDWMQAAMLECWHAGCGAAGNVRFTNGPLPPQHPSTYLLVVVGFALGWVAGDSRVGMACHDVSRLPAYDLWNHRLVWIDARPDHITSASAIGGTVYHELGHAFGMYGHDHAGMPPRPGYVEGLRKRVEVARGLAREVEGVTSPKSS